MSYEFKKLSEVEALTEVPEGATVLAEVGGAIKRIPGEGLGGGGGVGLLIEMTDPSDYTTATANMTLTEALEKLRAKELLSAAIFMNAEGTLGVMAASMIMDYSAAMGADCMVVGTNELPLMWTAAGFQAAM